MSTTPTKSISFNRYTLLLTLALALSSFLRYLMSPQDSRAAMAFAGAFLMVMLAALVLGAIVAAIARGSSRAFNITASLVIAAGVCMMWFWFVRAIFFPPPPPAPIPLRNQPPPPQATPRKP